MSDNDDSEFARLLTGVKRLHNDRVNHYQQRKPLKPAREFRPQKDLAPKPGWSTPVSPRDSFFHSGLQTKLQRRIRQGAIRPEATLDLHGYRRHEALAMLEDFLANALAQRQRMLPAGVPRSRRLTRAAKRVAHLLHRLGLRGLRGRLKTSRRVRDTLYRPLGDDERPHMDPETRARLKRHFQPEVAALDALLGTSLAERWGYTP